MAVTTPQRSALEIIDSLQERVQNALREVGEVRSMLESLLGDEDEGGAA